MSKKIIKENQTQYKDFIKLCKMSQYKLKQYLVYELSKKYNNIMSGDGYLIAIGTVPVILTAHLDTVHKELIQTYYEKESKGKHKLYSPQGIGGDDRCGVYMILEIIKELNCTVIFCEDEEKGCIGSTKLVNSKDIEILKELNSKYIIELDRANSKDAVFYEYKSTGSFVDFVLNHTNHKLDYGSYTDICILAPALNIAAVNLSCGYYKAHTKDEYVIMEEMFETIEETKKLILAEKESDIFIWEKETYNNYNYYSYNSNKSYFNSSNYILDYNEDYESGYADGYDDGYDTCKKELLNEIKDINDLDDDDIDNINMYITYVDINQNENYSIMYGKTQNDCWANFFKEHKDICYQDVLDFDIIK